MNLYIYTYTFINIFYIIYYILYLIHYILYSYKSILYVLYILKDLEWKPETCSNAQIIVFVPTPETCSLLLEHIQRKRASSALAAERQYAVSEAKNLFRVFEHAPDVRTCLVFIPSLSIYTKIKRYKYK